MNSRLKKVEAAILSQSSPQSVCARADGLFFAAMRPRITGTPETESSRRAAGELEQYEQRHAATLADRPKPDPQIMAFIKRRMQWHTASNRPEKHHPHPDPSPFKRWRAIRR